MHTEQTDRLRGRTIRFLLRVSSWLAVMALAMMGLMVLTHGRNQALTPQIVAERTWKGLPFDQTEYRLALPPGSLDEHSRWSFGRRVVTVTEPGPLGGYLCPQHQISLIFDAQDRLESARVTIVWRTDEESSEVALRDRGD